MSVWFVSASNPGLDAFLRLGCVAVNFWVREPVDALSPQDIRELVAVRTGPDLAPGAKTRFANQLAAFSEIAAGDQVLTFDRRDRHTLHVGTVTAELRYESEPRIQDHPHVVPVHWDGTIQRADLADGGKAIPSTPGTTVARIYDQLGVPPAQPEGRTARPRQTRPSLPVRNLARDGFTWDPPAGSHRYRLVQTFGREGEPEHPYVVFMVNPGGNDIERIRRSTTCHRVRAWGMAHGFDGASYLNLFSVITNDVRGLAAIHPEALNGPESDEVIQDVLSHTDGPVVAGWGNPSVQRSLFDRRIGEVRAVAGSRLKCLGVTDRGYPRHGRLWLPSDELLDLP